VAGMGFLGSGVGVSRGCTAEVMVLNLARIVGRQQRLELGRQKPDVAGLMSPGYTGDGGGKAREMPSLG